MPRYLTWSLLLVCSSLFLAESSVFAADQPTLIFAQLADGAGYVSEIILTNPGSKVDTGRIFFKDRSGLEMFLSIGGVVRSSLNYSVAAGGVFRVKTDGVGTLIRSGYVTVVSDDFASLITGSLVYSSSGVETSVPNSKLTSAYHSFVEQDGQTWSGLVFVNLRDDEAISIALKLVDESGRERNRNVISLAPRQHYSRLLNEVFPGLTSSFVGSVQATSVNEFAAVALRGRSSGSLAAVGGSATAFPSVGLAASFTDDGNFGAMAVHENGEKLVAMTQTNSSGVITGVTGAVWVTPTGAGFTVYLGTDGLPQRAVGEDFVFLFSNYTSTTVDIAAIHPNGQVQIARAVPIDATKIEELRTFRTSQFPLSDAGLALTGSDLAKILKITSFVASSVLCAVSASGVVASGGALLPVALHVAWACKSLILKIAGELLPQDNAALEVSKGAFGVGSCVIRAGTSFTNVDRARATTACIGAIAGLGSQWLRGSNAQISQRERDGSLGSAQNQLSQGQCAFTVSPMTQSFSATGGTGTVSVSAASGCNWTAISNASWITVTSGNSGSGNGSVTYSVSANSSTNSRSGTLTVAGQTVTITQAGISCSYTVSPASQSFGAAGGSGTVSVSTSSGCTWTASTNVSWITITSGSNGNGSGTVIYSVGTNTGSSSRTGTLTVAGQTITITQSGAATCSYTVTVVTTPSFGASGDTGDIIVDTADTCPWTVSSNVSWISIIIGSSSRVGAGLVRYSVSANAGSARVGTLTVAGQTVTISQAGVVACSYTVSPTSQSFSATGGTGTVNVTASTGCSWTAASNSSWITIVSGSGSGSGTVSYSVAANSETSSRSGTLVVAGQTVTISQSGLVAQTTCLSVNGEGLSNGTPIPGWNVPIDPNAAGRTTVTAVTAAANPSAVHSGSGAIRVNGDFYLGKELDTVCRGTVTVDYWHFPSSAFINSAVALFGTAGASQQFVQVVKNSEGRWSSGTTIGNYAGRYTHIAITVNTNTGRYDVSIDGQQVVSQAPVETPAAIANGIRYITLHSGSSGGGEDSYLDDIVITSR